MDVQRFQSGAVGLLEAQRPDLFLWVPVFLGIGIGAYFSLRFEPAIPLAAWAILLSVLLLGALRIANIFAQSGFWMAFLVVLGIFCGTMRTAMVAAPVLEVPMVASVEGRIIKRDISQTNRLRLLLDETVVYGLEASQTPKKIRVTLPVDADPVDYRAGGRVMVFARLSPPAPPVEAGGFDFRKYAWFRQLGGLGYALGPVMPALTAPKPDVYGRIQARRSDIAEHLKARVAGNAGGFAAAIVVGDRSSVELTSLKSLRASNLAHLLAISGLHMGLMTGLVYAALRFLMAAVPGLALNRPIKSYAATAAIIAGLAYLVFSGASVATQRAFIMVAVAYLAIIAGRPAITMRALAFAAMIILLLRPESLTEAGFQMSFAATVGLVAVFGWLSGQNWWRSGASTGIRLDRWFFGLLLSSATAGLATAPFAAYHFNQIAQFGLLANLVAVPLMGIVVMPALLVGLALTPIGADGAAFWIAGLGIDGILLVADTVAALEGAVVRVPTGHIVVIPLVALGCLVLALTKGRVKLAGIVPVIAGLFLWHISERPLVLIDPSGKLVGVLDSDGRALNKPKGQGFAAGTWLQNDGDTAEQKVANQRGSGLFAGDALVIHSDGKVESIGKTDGELMSKCQLGAIIIAASDELPIDADAPCKAVDKDFVAYYGAVAIFAGRQSTKIVTANDASGDRPWARLTLRKRPSQ